MFEWVVLGSRGRVLTLIWSLWFWDFSPCNFRDLIYAQSACNTPKRKENLKSYHMTPEMLQTLFFKEHPYCPKQASSCHPPPLLLPAAASFCSLPSAPQALRGCRCPWTISKLLFFDIIMQIDPDNVIGYLNVWCAAMFGLYNAWRKGHNRKTSVGVLVRLSFFFLIFSSLHTKEKLGLGFAPSLTFWLTVTNPLGSVTLWLRRKDSHEKVLVLLKASKGYNLMFSIREH